MIDFKELIDAIRENPAEFSGTLDFSHEEPITLEELRELAELLPLTKIDCLNFKDCDIDDARAEIIAAALPRTRVCKLELQKNRIGNQGAIAIAAALPQSHNLTHLNLRYNQVGDVGINALADAILRTRLIKLSTSGNENTTNEPRKRLLENLDNNYERVKKFTQVIIHNDVKMALKLLNESVPFSLPYGSNTLHLLGGDLHFFMAQLLLHDAYSKGYLPSLLKWNDPDASDNESDDEAMSTKNLIAKDNSNAKILPLLEAAERREPMIAPDMAKAPRVIPYLHIDTKDKTFDQIIAEISENPEAYTGTLDLSRVELNMYGFNKLCDLLPKTQFTALSLSLFSLSDDMTRISVGNILKNTRSIVQMDLKLTIMNLVVVCNLIYECKRLGSNLVKLNVSCVKINDAVINRDRDFNLLSNLVEFTATNVEGESLFYSYKDNIGSVLKNGRDLAQQLYDAAESGNVYKVKELLDMGVSPCSRYAKRDQNEFGSTVLDTALRTGNFLLTQLILHKAQKAGYLYTLLSFIVREASGTPTFVPKPKIVELLQKAMGGEIIDEPILPLLQEVDKPMASPGVLAAPEPIIEIAVPDALYHQLSETDARSDVDNSSTKAVVDRFYVPTPEPEERAELVVDEIKPVVEAAAAPVVSTLLSSAVDVTASAAVSMVESVFLWWTTPPQKPVPVVKDPETAGQEMQVRGAAPLVRADSSDLNPS